MPVEVRVGDRVHRVEMRDGTGSVRIGAQDSYTLDPQSKLLRQLDFIDEFQRDKTEREKAEAKSKAAAG
jgi:hypothetical protein